MQSGERTISRRTLVLGSLAAGGAVAASVGLPSFIEATGLSERMMALKGLLFRKITRYREYRDALDRAGPALRETLTSMHRGGPAWYARQPAVRAERESRFCAMSAAEHIFITRAQTVADCDFQHAVIAFYEKEFDDRHIARKYFWNAIAQRRVGLALQHA